MKKKIAAMILTTTLAASALMGCTVSTGSEDAGSDTQAAAEAESTSGAETDGAEERQAVLTFMDHTSEESKVAWEDSVIEAFEEAHPGVTVEVQRMSYDDYIQTLQTRFASGDAPDIYSIETAYIDTYIENGYIATLDDIESGSRFAEGTLGMLERDGSLYAIPFVASVMNVTYNKDVFEACGIEELPTTIDEFYQVCQTIQDAGYTAIGGAYSETWCLMADLQADYIGSVLTKDPNAITDVESRAKTFAGNQQWADVLTRIKDRLQYVNSDPFGTDWDSVCTALANGKTAMALNGNWTPNNVLAMNPDANLGAFPLPTTSDPADAQFTVQSPTEGLALNAESANLDLAKEFLDHWTSAESAQAYVDTNNEICIVEGVGASGAQGALKDVMDQIDAGNTKSLGAVDHNFTNEYRDAVQTVVSEFLLNDLSVDECLANLDTEFDRIAGQ